MGLVHETSMCGGLPDTLQISCFSAVYPDPYVGQTLTRVGRFWNQAYIQVPLQPWVQSNQIENKRLLLHRFL